MSAGRDSPRDGLLLDAAHGGKGRIRLLMENIQETLQAASCANSRPDFAISSIGYLHLAKVAHVHQGIRRDHDIAPGMERPQHPDFARGVAIEQFKHLLLVPGSVPLRSNKANVSAKVSD